MKNLTKRFVSFMLVFALALSLCAPAFAAEYSGANESENEIGTVDDIQLVCEAYHALSPEAKAVYEASLSGDPDAQEFFRTYINPDYQPSDLPQGIYAANPAAVAGSVDYVANLMARLGLLYLPRAVMEAFRAMAASMVVEMSSGLILPVGKILVAASAAAVVATVVLNWDKVSPKFNQIVKAFQDTFAEITSNISKAFAQIKQDAQKEVEEKKEAEAQAKKKESEQRIKDVLKGKKKDRTTSGNTNIYEGQGGLDAAEKDFNKLNEGRTVKRGETTVGQLPDGTKINVRSQSSDSRVTLEIQGKGQFKIKIRYNN